MCFYSVAWRPGGFNAPPAPVRLDLFCRDLVEEIVAASEARCPIEFEAASELPLAQADEELMRTALENLLSNAVKYSPAGLPVLLSVRRQAQFALFEVRNQGQSIPAEDQSRLFQPFERGGNAGSTPGTGLGLSIARRCAEVHGGEIRFESDDLRGTLFTLWLPVFGMPA